MKKWWNNLSKITVALMLIAITVLLFQRIRSDINNREVLLFVENEAQGKNRILNAQNIKQGGELDNPFLTDLAGLHYLARERPQYIQNIKGVLFSPAQTGLIMKLLEEEEIAGLFNGLLIIMENIKPPEHGELSIPEKYWGSLIRGHRIPDDEIVDRERVYLVNRLVRAVKERNIRCIVLQKDIRYIKYDLESRLKASGFTITDNVKCQVFVQNKFYLSLVLLGTLVLIINFFHILVGLNLRSNFLLFFGFMIALSFFFIAQKNIIAIQLVALSIAVIVPVFEYLLVIKKVETPHFIRFIISSSVSVFSGITVYLLLSNQNFILYLNRFRGVKLAYLIPLILVGVIIFVEIYEDIFKRFRTVDLLLFLVIFIFILIILLTRTGNYLQVNKMDVQFRSFLEKIF